MSQISQNEVLAVIADYSHEDFAVCWGDYAKVTVFDLTDGDLTLQFAVPFVINGIKGEVITQLSRLLLALPEIKTVNIDFSYDIQAFAEHNGVKNLVAVASAKGGVGKSTTAVNLALALQAEGAKVGILDADIYGPSQPIMLGKKEASPDSKDQKSLEPVEQYGLQTMSIGYLVTPEQAMVWRGPMASSALQQLLRDTCWKGLDYLIIDMPPGTGDIQLTISQKAPLAGAVIVTTPQEIAVADAHKGITMFHKVNIPVLGVVENMASYICPCCNHEDAIFGSDGGQHLAEIVNVPYLGGIPIDRKIREQTDAGRPTVVAEPDSAVTESYRKIARKMSAILARRVKEKPNQAPTIAVSED